MANTLPIKASFSPPPPPPPPEDDEDDDFEEGIDRPHFLADNVESKKHVARGTLTFLKAPRYVFGETNWPHVISTIFLIMSVCLFLESEGRKRKSRKKKRLVFCCYITSQCFGYRTFKSLKNPFSSEKRSQKTPQRRDSANL